MFDKPKWIIQDGELKMGRVEVHSQLTGDDDSGVVGGGLWYFDMLDTKIMYLYGSSIDYGQVKAEDFEDIWVRPSLEKTTIYFSTEMSLEDAKKNNIIIQDFD